MTHALVTGATGGIGMSLVRVLLARGQKVVASGRDAEAGARLAAMGAGLKVSGPEGDPAVWKPRMGRDDRERLLKGWRAAVRGVLEIARAGA